MARILKVSASFETKIANEDRGRAISLFVPSLEYIGTLRSLSLEFEIEEYDSSCCLADCRYDAETGCASTEGCEYCLSSQPVAEMPTAVIYLDAAFDLGDEYDCDDDAIEDFMMEFCYRGYARNLDYYFV